MNHNRNFEDRLKRMTDEQLIDAFNREVGNMGWTSSRGPFLTALHQEFVARGFDYSIVGDRNKLSFKKKIKLIGKKIEIGKIKKP